jgi:peptidoglycan/LPS O-acetylase OafA/YrhL
LALLVGGFRTLRKMSGGLRLLSGAWGFAAGLLIFPLTNAQSPSWGEIGFALIALAGLALTVLHQEKKK